jgi:hypothetical protein
MPAISIQVGNEEFSATLEKDKAPETVQDILDCLPLEGEANTWGEEIYFPIPVDRNLENGCDTVSVGDLGYWPTGNAFCIFYGKTPMSESEEAIKPASPVTPIGHIEDAEALKKHSAGEAVTVQLAE